MPKEPVTASTRQPPKRQAPAHKPAAPVTAAQGELVQRAMTDPTSLSPADVAALQRSVGNRAVQRLLARPQAHNDAASELVLQQELAGGVASDAHEQGARQGALDQSQAPLARVQRAMTPPDEEEKLQRQPLAGPAVGQAGGEVSLDVDGRIEQARGAGQPLHGGARSAMESAFHADFSRVRVHSNRQSDQLNRTLSARAFTTGQDLFFKEGEYDPYSTAGQTLLAHELTHVVQQTGPAVQRKGNKARQRAYEPAVRLSTTGQPAQRATWDYASQERKKWTERNTAAKMALVPFGGIYGAGKAGYQSYKGIYERLRGSQGENASGLRKFGAGVGSAVLGTLALPFAMAWGLLRGTASGLANPLVSAGKRLPGAWNSVKSFFRQGVGSYRGVPQDQRGAVDGSNPVPETAEERQSRLAALMGRRGPLPDPNNAAGNGQRGREDVGVNRGENVVATSGRDLGGYTASGGAAAAAAGRTLTGWSSGASDINFSSGLSGATSAFSGLGAGGGLLGTGAALAEVSSGYQQAADASTNTTERGLGVGQALAGTGDAVRQSSMAAFNLASLTGNAAAAAAATVVAGGASVAMGVIDVLRGTAGALTANKRHQALLVIIDQIEREASLTQLEKLRLITAAREGARTQQTRIQTGAVTAAKGAVTIAGGALLIALGMTSPVGWMLLGGAALVGGIYALYKLQQKSKRKRQLAARELGIESWRQRWKAKKKAAEASSWWGSQDRRNKMKNDVGEDPLNITLRSQGYESAGHFYARYIRTTAQTIYDNAVAGPAPDPQRREDDHRALMVQVVEAMGLRIDRTKETHAPTVKRIAEVLDN